MGNPGFGTEWHKAMDALVQSGINLVLVLPLEFGQTWWFGLPWIPWPFVLALWLLEAGPSWLHWHPSSIGFPLLVEFTDGLGGADMEKGTFLVFLLWATKCNQIPQMMQCKV